MPTIVTSVLSTTNDGHGRGLTVYTSLQAWEDACPANLVTDDKIWKGECYNDGEFTTGLSVSGITTDATRYLWLTTAPGQSFMDHADARTSPLTYDQSKGVGIRGAGPFSAPFMAAGTNNLIERLQVKTTSANYSQGTLNAVGGTLKNCIAVAGGGIMCATEGSGTAINCAFIVEAGPQPAVGNLFDYDMTNCTLVRSSNLSAAGTSTNAYGYSVWKNCAIFNHAGLSGNFTGSSGLATDLASIGTTGSPSSAMYGVRYDSCFVSTRSDFRLKPGSPLIGAGTTDMTYHAQGDITGMVREPGSKSDIGCWTYTPAKAVHAPSSVSLWTPRQSRLAGTSGGAAPVLATGPVAGPAHERRKQPASPERLDDGNPITRGLLVAWTPVTQSRFIGPKGVGLVAYGTPAVALASDGLTRSAGAHGWGLAAPANASSPTAFLDRQAFTILVRVRGTTSTGNSEPAVTRVGPGGANPWSLGLWKGSNNGGFFRCGTINRGPSGTEFDVTDRWRTCLLMCDGSNAWAYFDRDVYVAPASAGALTYTYGGYSAGVGNFSVGYTSGNVLTSLAAWWDRPLSDVEARSLIDSPWQIFAPIKSRKLISLPNQKRIAGELVGASETKALVPRVQNQAVVRQPQYPAKLKYPSTFLWSGEASHSGTFYDVARSVKPAGRVLEVTSSATSARADFPLGAAPPVSGSLPWTIIALQYFPTAPGTVGIFGLRNNPNGPVFLTHGGLLAFYTGGGWVDSAMTVGAGLHLVALKHNGDGTGRFYLDGTSEATSALGATSTPYSAVTLFNWDPNYSPISSPGIGSYIAFAALLPVAVPDAELAEIARTKTPWQLFKRPAPRPIHVNRAPTTSDATAARGPALLGMKRRKQPQHPVVIDPSYAKDVLYAYAPAVRTDNKLAGSANGTFSSTVARGIRFGEQVGLFTGANGASEQLTFNVSYNYTFPRGHTLIVRGVFRSPWDGGWALFHRGTFGGESGGFGLSFGRSSGVETFGSSQRVAGVNHVAQPLYINGLDRGTAAITNDRVTPLTIVAPYNPTDGAGFYNTTFGIYMGADVSLMAWLDRKVSPAEALSLSANPWQIFSPRAAHRRIYLPRSS